MLKTRGAFLGLAAVAVIAALALASMAVTTTSGAGTDSSEPTVVAAPTTAPSTPPQSPIEPPANTGVDATGDQAGAGALPSAGYGADNNGSPNFMLLLVLAGVVLAGGTAFMFVGGKAPGNRK